MAGSVRDPCRKQFIPQDNSLKTRITSMLATAIRYLIYNHSTFLRHKVILALPNTTILCCSFWGLNPPKQSWKLS